MWYFKFFFSPFLWFFCTEEIEGEEEEEEEFEDEFEDEFVEDLSDMEDSFEGPELDLQKQSFQNDNNNKKRPISQSGGVTKRQKSKCGEDCEILFFFFFVFEEILCSFSSIFCCLFILKFIFNFLRILFFCEFSFFF